MKSKPLWHISVITSPEAEDATCELLASLFSVPAAAWFDLERQTSRVSVFLEPGKFSAAGARAEIAAGMARIKSCGLKTAPPASPRRLVTSSPTIEIARVKREDWAESWKRHFHPLTIGTKLLLKPSWSKKRPVKHQAVVILDPGLSFGTGQHPTTSFCLREIVRCHKMGAKQSFLDIGTGSGILAIAAAKLGYAPVRAFDFDPESVRVAGENTRKNRVADRVRLTRGDVTRLALRPRQQFDLVCANLIANLLIAERQRITNRLKPGGTLVLAGILAAEFAEVERAYADMGLKLCASRTEKEWRSGAFCFA